MCMTGEKRPARAAMSVRQLMNDAETGFGRVLQRARALDQLNQRVSGLLGPELARSCQVANVRDGRIIFVCRSPGCATRLRMQSRQILGDLHAAGLAEIEAIDVKVDVSRGYQRR